MASAEDLRALVGAILDSIFFEADLRERWASRALAWLLEAESPHLAGRSHQVCCARLSQCLTRSVHTA